MANDAARGNQFSLLARELITTIRQYRPPTAGRQPIQLVPGELAPGATDPTTNVRFAAALHKARDAGFPKAKIEAAIAKAGGKKSQTLLTSSYEFFGPAPAGGGQGVALLLECMTDNPSRTNAKVKEAVSKFGCRFTKTAHFFSKIGYVRVLLGASPTQTYDALFEAAIEAGADEVQELDPDDLDPDASEALMNASRTSPFEPAEEAHVAEVLCQPGDLHSVLATIANLDFTIASYDREQRPTGSKFYQAYEPGEDATPHEIQEQHELCTELEQYPNFLGWFDSGTIEQLDRLHEFLETRADAVALWSNCHNWPPE